MGDRPDGGRLHPARQPTDPEHDPPRWRRKAGGRGFASSAANPGWYPDRAMAGRMGVTEALELMATSPVPGRRCQFLPYVHGPKPRQGAFAGLGSTDDLGSMTRAICEGVAFRHRRHAEEILPHAGGHWPGAIRLTRVEPGSPGAISGHVVPVENMGAEGQVIVEVDGAEMSFVTRGFRDLGPGDTVSFALAPEQLHIFDRATGRSCLGQHGHAPAPRPHPLCRQDRPHPRGRLSPRRFHPGRCQGCRPRGRRADRRPPARQRRPHHRPPHPPRPSWRRCAT